jgi:hypothetical protein
LLFSDDDSRDDVGFLGSLPLPQRPQSKPVTPWSPPVVAFFQLNRTDNSFHPAYTQGAESRATLLINDPLRLTLVLTEKMKFEVVCGATTAIVGVVGMKQYVPLWTA